MQKLKFSDNSKQAKLKHIPVELAPNRSIWSFNLPSGYSCPGANKCLSKADKITGKITDGSKTLYRCFSASDEARSPQARKQRWDNFDQLRKLDTESMIEAIQEALPCDCDICRIHVGGDFFNQKYFNAWVAVAKLNPTKTFYAYTKSLPYWVAQLDNIPSNLILNASRGTRVDFLIDELNLKVAEVVFSITEAKEKNLPIDHNEYFAINNNGNFALLLHGTQPKNSEASQAIKDMKKSGVAYSYSR